MTTLNVGITYLPVGTDLYPLLTKPTGAPLYLIPKAPYKVSQTATIPAQLSILGQDNPLQIVRTPGASSGIIVRGDGCQFTGLLPQTAPGGVTFRLYGLDPSQRKTPSIGTTFIGCTWQDGCADTAIDVEAWSDDVTVERCKFGVLKNQSIYATADRLRVISSTFAGSLTEHPIRLDLNGTTRHRPISALISDCDVINHNALGKEAIAVRECDQVLIQGGTIDGWLDLGQGNTDTQWHCRNAVVYRVRFPSLRPGGALIQVRHDTDVVFEGCEFPGSASDCAILADERTSVYSLDNQWSNVAPAGVAWKPMVAIAPTGKLIAA